MRRTGCTVAVAYACAATAGALRALCCEYLDVGIALPKTGLTLISFAR